MLQLIHKLLTIRYVLDLAVYQWFLLGMGCALTVLTIGYLIVHIVVMFGMRQMWR